MKGNMFTVKKFLSWELETGGVFIGWLWLCFLVIYECLFVYNVNDELTTQSCEHLKKTVPILIFLENLKKAKDVPKDIFDEKDLPCRTEKEIWMMVPVNAAVVLGWAFASALLIFGINARKYLCVIPMTICEAVAVLLNIYFIATEWPRSPEMWIFRGAQRVVYQMAYCVFHCYAFVVLYSLCKKLKEENKSSLASKKIQEELPNIQSLDLKVM